MSGRVSAQVLKAMGIFGGVRMLHIIFGVIRVKLIAVLLGPSGVGLFGIFNGAVDTVKAVSQLGVRSSAVRDIAGASESSPTALSTIVTVVRRWGVMLGVLGAVIMAVGAPWLSRLTFGSGEMTLHYIALAAALFFLSVAGAEEAVLQGSGELGRLAKASVWGVFFGLIVSIPMYFLWGIDSVVPSIIAFSAATCIAILRYRRRGVAAASPVSLGQTFEIGRRFIALGICMTAADFLAQAMSYVFVVWLNNRSGDGEVGLYQAGYTMVNRYVGLIFAALATEYYPRLVRVAASRRRLNAFVAHEMSVILLLLLPAVLLFISFAPWMVRLLYDSRFDAAVPFITIAMAGIVLRGVSYCMSYVILAKGDGVTFLITETVSAILGLGLNLVCYSEWGVAGLGVSYTLWYLLYVANIGIVYRYRYGLSLSSRLMVIATAMFVLVALSTIVALTVSSLWILPLALAAALVTLSRLRNLFRR